MVKLSDVAAAAGVGVGTASRAISGRGYIDPETRQRVLDAAASLGYRPNASARALRERRTRTIGLLLPDIVNEFYTASADVIQTVLDEAGFQLVVAITRNDVDTERRALDTMIERQVDGIVHVPVDPAVVYPDHVPVVQLNRFADVAGTSAVISDDVDGIRRLTAAVIGAGHTDLVAIVGPPDLSTSRERLEGFHAAIDAAGIPLAEIDMPRPADGRRARVVIAPFSAEGGEQALVVLLDDLPSAVVVLSNRQTLGVLDAAGEHGVAIPGDLSVAGMGDPEWFRLWKPGITTYAPPLAEMGRQAASMLLTMMGTGEPATAQRLSLPGEVRVRGTVAGLVPGPSSVSALPR